MSFAIGGDIFFTREFSSPSTTAFDCLKLKKKVVSPPSNPSNRRTYEAIAKKRRHRRMDRCKVEGRNIRRTRT